MTQEELLQVIKENPGITQVELRHTRGAHFSNISHKLCKLQLKKLIRREKDKQTWRLYLI